jgi:hypothetical protein
VTIENPSLRQVAVAIPILGLFQRLNIARIYCFLRMNTIVAYPLERIEPSPLNLSSGLPSFQRKVVSLSCY